MSGQPKFTPGPWHARGDVTNNRWLLVSSAGGVLARKISNGEDAHLIAAAPDLYEALTAALHHLHDIDNQRQRDAHKEGDRYSGLPALRQAEEALSKAEGRS